MSRRSKTFRTAMGGICIALAFIFVFGASFVPGIELTLFAVSSLFTAVMLLETGTIGGLLVYAGASILGLLILPNKLAIIPYVFLFGYYAVLKYYIEKIKSGVIQIALKTIFFAALLCVGLLLCSSILTQSIHLPDYPVYVLIIGGILFLLLYDFVLTLLINWYMRRFRGDNESSLKLS